MCRVAGCIGPSSADCLPSATPPTLLSKPAHPTVFEASTSSYPAPSSSPFSTGLRDAELSNVAFVVWELRRDASGHPAQGSLQRDHHLHHYRAGDGHLHHAVSHSQQLRKGLCNWEVLVTDECQSPAESTLRPHGPLHAGQSTR